jgi:hypothetical protein
MYLPNKVDKLIISNEGSFSNFLACNWIYVEVGMYVRR